MFFICQNTLFNPEKSTAGITSKTIKSFGLPFRQVMYGLVEFLQSNETIPIIISYGGYLHHFPILLANCIKRNYDWPPLLEGCMFVDITRVLPESGYKRSGLDAPCKDLNMKRNRHSASVMMRNLLLLLQEEGMPLLTMRH